MRNWCSPGLRLRELAQTKAYVDGVTVSGWPMPYGTATGASARDAQGRPELVNMDMAYGDEHRAIHYAVLDRSPEMVRLLMQHGAKPGRESIRTAKRPVRLTLASRARL